MKTIPLTIFTIFFILATSQGQLGKGKSVIKYLGTTFLMNDGCPAPRCNEKKSECARIRQMVRALYSHCLQSQVKFVINRNKTKKYIIGSIYDVVVYIKTHHFLNVTGWATCRLCHRQDWRWKLFNHSCICYNVLCNVLRNQS